MTQFIKETFLFIEELEAWLKKERLQRIKEIHKKRKTKIQWFYLPDNAWGWWN